MKTIEQASMDYALSREDNDYIIETGMAFEAGARFAQRWTSVEEELPPLGAPVICRYNMFDKEYHWTGTFYTKERIMHFIKKHLKITHWRLIELK